MKQIVLLLDGTWNDADFGERDTNIVRIRNLIARYVRKREEEAVLNARLRRDSQQFKAAASASRTESWP